MSKPVMGTYLEHLDELRRRLWVAVAAFLICSFVSLFYSDQLLKIALSPAEGLIPSLYFFTPADAFVVKIKLALLSGFLISSPVIISQFWLFVSPGLHEHEKKAIVPFTFFSSALFLSGAAFAFFKIVPLTLQILLGMQTEWLKPMVSAGEYLSFLSLALISFGVAFDLPVFVLLLVLANVVNVQMLNQFQRQAVVLIFIAAAILTPGPDIASQLLLAIPLLLLYEASVFLAMLVDRAHRKKKEKVLAG